MTKVLIVYWRNSYRNGFCKNFSAVINVKGVGELQAGARRNNGVQVNHGTALLPYECVEKGVAAIRGSADNLAPCIDCSAPAARIVIDSS